ncbi:MAG TPA: hypothetical protein VHB54_09455 [Mucilaginibacter sp.]|nr:hypothetical protein [Mucilaginibacter sp.]
MKKLILLIIFSAIYYRGNCQNSRWMFLSKSEEGSIFLVDTLQQDIQQVSNFGNHENVVIFWITVYKEVATKKGSYATRSVEKIAVDTANKQYNVITGINYKGSTVVNSFDGYDYDWHEVVPETMSERYAEFARSLNNENLKSDLKLISYLNYNPYDPLTKRFKKSKH